MSALVATGSKAAVFALLIRFPAAVSLLRWEAGFILLEVLAIVTMSGGNLLALAQTNLKRLLAYSSVAHIGYLLIPLVAGDADAMASIEFYFASYFLTMIAAFGVVAVLSRPGAGELEELDGYGGLALQRPWRGGVLAFMMLSLAGIPLTMGFFARFYILAAAARNGLWLLLIVGVVNSGLAAYYYLRVLVALYLQPAGAAPPWPRVGAMGAVTLGVLAALVLALGVYPTPLFELARHTASMWPMG